MPRKPKVRKTLHVQRPVRFSAEQDLRLVKAAELLTERARETVTIAEIIRDGANRYADEILAGQQKAA